MFNQIRLNILNISLYIQNHNLSDTSVMLQTSTIKMF